LIEYRHQASLRAERTSLCELRELRAKLRITRRACEPSERVCEARKTENL
jgi:hypothetical protein